MLGKDFDLDSIMKSLEGPDDCEDNEQTEEVFEDTVDWNLFIDYLIH